MTSAEIRQVVRKLPLCGVEDLCDLLLPKIRISCGQTGGIGARNGYIGQPFRPWRIAVWNSNLVSHLAQYRARYDGLVEANRIEADSRIVQHIGANGMGPVNHSVL